MILNGKELAEEYKTRVDIEGDPVKGILEIIKYAEGKALNLKKTKLIDKIDSNLERLIKTLNELEV